MRRLSYAVLALLLVVSGCSLSSFRSDVSKEFEESKKLLKPPRIEFKKEA